MGEIRTEPENKNGPLSTTREPKTRPKPGDPDSMGGQALNDALMLLVAGWLLLFFLSFSLRNYNV